MKKSQTNNVLKNDPESAYGSKNEPDGEVKNQRINTESEESSAFSFVPELDDVKKTDDESKTVTFAEDVDVFDPHLNTATPVTVSLVLNDHVTDHRSSVLIEQDEVQENETDILSVQDIELGSTHTLDNVTGEKQPIEDQTLYNITSTPVWQRVLSLIPESDSSETLTDKEKAEVTDSQNPVEDNKDINASDEPKIVQVNDGHKEFKVLNVDESELATDHEVNAKLITNDTPFSDAHPLFQRLPSSLSDGVSPSTDINYQDTIGPLDNPDFLRTLHYSVSHQPAVSHPAIQDELYSPKSNLDLRSLSALQDPPDLDKGWAWVVLLAGFITSALLGATVYAAGVLMLTILQEINPDLTKVSWIGSLFVCSMCMSGPFVEAALKQFGARVTVFCAGIVITAGFVGAFFATNITELILTHGLIAGVGAGFVANPVSVSVGQYFHRYRGLACGLLATGAGAGMLTGGTVISCLLDEYGLSGTYLIWAGVLFHTAVLGLLLRPSPEERLRTLERNVAVKESQQRLNNQLDVVSGLSLFRSVNQSMLSGIDKISYGKRSTRPKNFSNIRNGEPEIPLLKADHCHDLTHSTHSATKNEIPPCSHVSGSLQHEQFGQNLVLGDDLQYKSLSGSLNATPQSNSPHTAPSFNHYTLVSNVPQYCSANNLEASELTHLSATPNNRSFASRSTCDLDKISHGKRLKESIILNKISGGDQELHMIKPTFPYKLFHSSTSIATSKSKPRSHVTSSSWHSKFSQRFGLGDRPHSSLSASSLATPKVNSPPTIPSFTDNVHNSLCQGSVRIVAASDLIQDSVVLKSLPSSPASIRGPQAHNKIQHYRLSQASLSQYNSMSRSSLRLSFRGSLHASHTGELDSESMTSALVSQLRSRDVLMQKYTSGSRNVSTFMGSVGSIPTALAIVKDDVSRLETFSTVGVQEKGLKAVGIKTLDSLRLLRRKPFLIFLSVCFFWSFGESPIMIYLPSYAISLGTSPMQASMLYTAMGTGSILGRFLSGLTATDINIGPVILYTGCLGLAGLLVVLSPIITTTFTEQVIFSCLAGIYTGALVPLSSLTAIEMLEIGELGIGFGFISMAQGLGYLMGPPLASIIVRAIGYRKAFVFSGFVLMFGSFMALFVSVFLKNTEDEEHALLQKSDLEMALQKIANSENKHENVVRGDGHNEETISKIIAGSLSTVNESKENPIFKEEDGTLVESNREVPSSHKHNAGDDKLGTIKEVAGK